MTAHPERDDVVAVVSELGSNAIRHSLTGDGGTFTVELTVNQAGIRVAVTDGGGMNEPQTINNPLDEHGRGLLLVQGLCSRMGVAGDRDGRTVWAEVERSARNDI